MITPEQKAAMAMANAAALNATVAGMIARNQYNALRKQPPTWLESDFEQKIILFDCHHNQLCKLFHEG